MEIEILKLIVTEGDLADLFQKNPTAGSVVRELEIRIETDGVRLKGKYPFALMTIPFDTFWKPMIQSGNLHIKLERINLVGMPASMLQGAFMKAIKKMTAREAGVEVEGTEIVIHVEKALQARGLSLRTNLRDVSCLPGQLILQSFPEASAV